ncbi:MAG: glycosyl hydrolase 53 family protein, partial [Calditrichaeota bacterium]|nr:glycosyl hydrolase 53 family protein [Calditrichota bacterium]
MTRKALILLFMMITGPLSAQSFYFGSDMSYVNEMEDCGVTYYEDGEAKDPYSIFADHGCNLVRLRLWHTPAWYDSLNQGKRYSDLADVKR